MKQSQTKQNKTKQKKTKYSVQTSIFDVNCCPHSAFNLAIITFSISSDALFAVKSLRERWER